MFAARRTAGWWTAGTIAVMAASLPAPGADFWLEEDWDDGFSYATEDGGFELRGGFGAIGIEAREHVFIGAGSSNNLSLLVWQGVAPTATLDMTARSDGWTVGLRGQLALLGDSHMEDYDWLPPFAPGFGPDQWSHQSVHQNTNLDWYFDGAVAIGRDIATDGAVRVNVNGGFKYTDVQWTAIGGSFIYSDAGFRDFAGIFPDTPAITYRQQLPTLFAGLDIDAELDGWSYGLDAKAGVTLFARATDDHWMRVPPRRFVDTLDPAPMLSAVAHAGYAFSDNLSAYVEGGIEKVFLGRGDTEVFDAGVPLGTATDVAGAELGTVSLSAGLKGRF